MKPTIGELLEYRNQLYAGRNTPIDFQIAVVEDMLRQEDVISGSATMLVGYDDGYRDGVADMSDE